MWALGPIGFAAPLALAALAALPVAWWLLRATPPPPRRVPFPPFRLLLGLRDPQETPAKTPWWLVLLRLAAAALVIVAAAQPVLDPLPAGAPLRSLVLVIDDGWAAAQAWPRLTGAAEAALARAEASDAQVRLLFTAPDPDGRVAQLRTDAEGARARLRARSPRPWGTDRVRAAQTLRGAGRPAGPVEVLWAADGVEDGGARPLNEALRAIGRPTVVSGPAPVALGDARATSDGLQIAVLKPAGQVRSGYVALEDEAGATLARAPFRLGAAAERGTALLTADWAALNRAVLARVEGLDGAGAVRVLSAAARRPLAAVVAPPLERGSPLANGAFYVSRALAPNAAVREGALAEGLRARPDALMLPGGVLAGEDAAAAEAFVEAGGVLVRFADGRLLANPDGLLPAPLAPRPRALDGALTWARPQGLGSATAGPLAGLAAPADAQVRRLAAYAGGAPAGVQVWASLADGSPLVTAARRGRGWLVLAHLEATPGGSDLPLTGAFVELLGRLARLGLPLEAASASPGPWTPERLLDGFGRWREPGPEDAPVLRLDETAGPGRAPGLYRAGTVAGALNTIAPTTRLESLPVRAAEATVADRAPRQLAGGLLFGALLLLLADGLLTGWLVRPSRAAKAAAVGAAVLLLAPVAVRAQTPTDLAAETRLAYVVTGDPTVDRASRAGLETLTNVLRQRTAVSPGAPVGVDPARSELAFHPVLYWPITPSAGQPSPAAAARLAAYLRSGGLILFDTRDDGAPEAAVREALRRTTAALDPPPLRPVNQDHVLSRTFYLLDSFPGRRPEARVWAATRAGETVDGVSPVLIGGGDWAAAWAGQGVGAQGREMALRFGVNWVLYALTGTYKADQVHVPALLERLREGGRR